MRFLVLEDVCGVGPDVVVQVCGEVLASGGGNVSIVLGVSVTLGISMIPAMGLGLGCRGSLAGFGNALGVVLHGFRGVGCD